MQISGAELVVKLLEQQGITTISGIPGGAALPLYDALSQSTQIQHILARHEQGAGFIAQGMARVTGKAAVCIASSGPGATNLVTAIADAKMDSIPLVCITAQVANSMIGTDAFQEVDTYGISIPITKYNYLVRSIDELQDVINEAFYLAESGRPGPVWIDIPKDVQLAKITLTYAELAHNRFAVLNQQDIPSQSSQFQAAASLINQSKRPVLYLGGGVIHANAGEEAKAFVEHTHLPTTMTLMGLGAIPTDHPYLIGMLGMHAARYTNYILQEADLLCVIGARFDDRAIGKVSEFCPSAKIIHIDIDAAEIHKIKQAHIAIEAHAKMALQTLLPLVENIERSEWLNRVDQLKKECPLVMDYSEDPLSHYGLIKACAEVADDDALVTTDVGQHQMWVAQAYPIRFARQWLTSGGLGTMGFGLPAAIGAALAAPEKQILCFTGDGSIMMNLQEFATAVEHQLNVKIILMNNRALGLVHQQQTLFYQKHIYASTYHCQTDFIQVTKGFGMPTCDLNQAEDPIAALAAALNQKGPCLIHVAIDMHNKVYPMVAPGAANINMIIGEQIEEA